MKFDYELQIQRFVNLIRAGEKPIHNFKVGVELEHIIVHQNDGSSVPYLGDEGIEGIMQDLIAKGWVAHDESGYVLTVTKEDMIITTEPGAQLEFSMTPKKTIAEMEETYNKFQSELLPILEERGLWALSIAYHPKTKINEINLLPKDRYHNMFDYFKQHGSRSHNMMKGTCALQIAVDFSDEEDYRKKFYVSNMLSNVFYSMFENGFFFEGEPCEMHNIRAYIWENTDNDRSGLVKGALDPDFNYEKYAKYLLERPAIYAYVDGEMTYTKGALIKDLVDPENAKDEELMHLFTMFFPDVRTKNFIEIRMFDAVPYPLSFSAIALMKGLLYDEENLEELYQSCRNLDVDRVMSARQELYYKGFGASQCERTVFEVALDLLEMARLGLPLDERKYLEPLEEMLTNRMNPYLKTEELYKRGFIPSVKWCALGEGGNE
ncbi:MAG: glutamate--cysteine ligase [Tissierellia bacterium]|nr:glutamate--cysteine ligase [Tissierellia bacterium]